MADQRAPSNQSLINILLNEFNYRSWVKAMETALGGRSKLGHVYGNNIPTKETDGKITTEFEEWKASDLGVMTWIFNSMDLENYEIFSYANTAKELWDSIKEMYDNTNNAARVLELQQQLTNLKKSADQPFTNYLGKMKKQWEELRQYRPRAATVEEYWQREEEDKILILLANLNPEFEETRREILMRSELPSFAAVCSIIHREEARTRVMNTSTKVPNNSNEIFVHLTKAENVNKWNKDKKKMFCDHCRRTEHTKDRCWVLHPHLKPSRNPREAHLVASYEASTGAGASDKNNTSAGGLAELQVQMSQLNRQMHALLNAQTPQVGGSITGSTAMTNLSGNTLTFFTKSNSNIVVDSGATDHMFSSNRMLNQTVDNDYSYVTVANGTKVPTNSKGKTKIFSKDINAIVVPELKANLLSVSKWTNECNCNVLFTPQKVIFQERTTGRTIGEGRQVNGLYVITSNFSGLVTTGSKVDPKLWQKRLGHPSDKILYKLNRSLIHDSNNCDCCHFAKQHRLPFSEHLNKTNDIFDLVHSYTWGNAPVVSREGFRYFVTFIDDKSRTTWLYLLKSKREVISVFKEFYNMVRTQFNKAIKILRTDNGTEYTNHEFQNNLRELGIIHQTTCPRTPQQNGFAERKNRHLLEVTRSLLFSGNLPKLFWADAILASCYLINRLPSKILDYKSPLEIVYKRDINLSHLRCFGCICYLHVQNSNKLDPRSKKCVFIGYSSLKKGYKVFDPSTNSVHFSRDVTFAENQVYYSEQGEDYRHYSDLSPIPYPCDADQAQNLDQLGPSFRPSDLERANMPSSLEVHINSESHRESSAQETHNENDTEVDAAELGPLENTDANRERQMVRRSTRQAQKSSRLNDFITYSTLHPIQTQIHYKNISQKHYSFLTAMNDHTEPTNFFEAQTKKVWVDAMNDELGALAKNQTWELVQLPQGKQAVGCKWIYKTKFNSDGSVERYKARLVARGFTQTYGIDYKETFASVTKMNTVRTVMSVAVNCDWPLFQMDVKNAFLQGELEEEVYMELPPGLQVDNEEKIVCRLKKAIYGLKQSPRTWYGRLSNTLFKGGFKRSGADSSMFTQVTQRGLVVILIYVDDLVITGSDLEGINDLKKHLKQEFDIKDLGILKYFLGIEVARSHKGLFLSQRKYVLDLLQETEKLGIKPANIPMEYGNKVTTNKEPLDDVRLFQRLVGKLIYLTITRPDISYTVSYISQFMQSPLKGHMELVNQLLRYLKLAPGRGILMTNNGHTEIEGYADADWAGSPHDRKSTTGYCMFVGNNLVSWKCKKQDTVARSSAEAEYRAMAVATSEIVWLRLLLQELGFGQNKPTTLHCDNLAAIHIASNPVFHERTKHIEVDCHYVREKVLDKTIETPHIRSNEQLADVFTKALSKSMFQKCIDKLTSNMLYGPT
jgi:Reverse transcriptase (RNA-dependent DNA polymerase)/Integrase core domain/gag-polypeptide of LTR copia-type